MNWKEYLYTLIDLFKGIKPNKNYATSAGGARGIGCDYNWMKYDPWKWFQSLAKEGLTATEIDLFGWGTTSIAKIGTESRKKPYKEWLEAGRHYKIITVVIGANDNTGSGKYGDPGIPLSKYNTQLEELSQIVLSNGPEGVWYQPIAEANTSYGIKREESEIKRFRNTGFLTVYNKGSRPTSPGPANFNSYHPFKTSDVGTAGDIIVGDTATYISEVMEGGLYGKEFKDQALYNAAKKVHDAGQDRGYIAYPFTGQEGIDEGACKAVANAWK